MDVRAVLATKRDGGELSRESIEAFVRGYVAGEVADYQASALLMAIYVHGMAERELEHWTRALLHSGAVLSFSHVPRPKADKHSTGGIGDKVSLALAPAVAACGVAVPMISGRGLGHTGGTLDKLEAITGLRTELDSAAFSRQVERLGVAFGAQTDELVPADRRLYALRDVTGLIESIPLIASSILAKKLAEGLDALVLDVKFGSGAFLREPQRGAELARTMQELALRLGLRASVFQTSMEQPLGRCAGNALEVGEALACLAARGPGDLRELVCLFGGEMLRLCGRVPTRDEGSESIALALDSGAALERFEQVVVAQGGDPRCVHDVSRLPRAPDVELFHASASGALGYRDLREIGWAIVALGGGRKRLGDAVDPAVGIVFLRRAGDELRAGEPVLEIHHRAGAGLDEARERIGRALSLQEAPPLAPLVLRDWTT